MELTLVPLSEQTTFLVIGSEWINVDEIAWIRLEDSITIHMNFDEKEFVWDEKEEVEEIKRFLLDKASQLPWN